MFNSAMVSLGKKRSVIRDLFEYGKQYQKEHPGAPIYDFTLGNPSVPAPEAVKNAAIRLLKEDATVHAYTSAQGDESVRERIALFNREKYGLPIEKDRVYLTCGAAAGLAIALRALVTETQDEVVVFAPFFPEYDVFIKNAGGKTVIVPFSDPDHPVDFDALSRAISGKTAAVIVNSPNNPSGMVYSKAVLEKIAAVLRAAEKKTGNVIVLLSDEPYREISFGSEVLSPLSFYDDAVLCYSYSKSLSLPGERIGFLAVSENMAAGAELYAAILGAGRSMGYVCAPSLFQKVVGLCAEEPSFIEPYRENRDIFYAALKGYGYEVFLPQGAFYLMMKAPGGDANAFSCAAKKRGLLLVPTDSFAAPGFLRIATCVPKKRVLASLPVFEALAKDCGVFPEGK